MEFIALTELEDRPVSHNPAILKKVYIRSGTVPHITGLARSLFKPGQTAPAHRHTDMYEVFCVLEGQALFNVDGHEHLADSGDCILIAPGEQHEISNPGSAPLVLQYFGVST